MWVGRQRESHISTNYTMNKESKKILYAAFLAFKGRGFVSFQYRDHSTPTSKILINLGASYDKARLNDLITLNEGVRFLRSPFYTRADWNEALQEIRLELQDNSTILSHKQLSPYLHLNAKVSNLKFSHRTRKLYVFGKVERETVLRQATTRRVLTPVETAKKMIQDTYLKTSRFKLFLLNGMRGSVKINKEVIEI